MLQQVLSNDLKRLGKSTEIFTILTQVVVDVADPAFGDPTKPIGPWLTHEEMLVKRKEGETWTEHPEKGWRRLVPSPRPVRIVNARGIEALLRNGFLVVACGGGGVPVIETADGTLQGVEAVIDKDLASECLATDIRAHILLILTDVPAVYLNFGAHDEKPIGRIRMEEMRKLIEEEGFPPGTIGPKVEAAVRFVEKGGQWAIIASLDHAEEALKGKSGTIVEKG
jgi:carbamate kinase